ncbi:MAG: hypothetical protein JNL09_05970 [Anaerolineales bacterium]|nr:hypothetical protein [Anaerolineales bacterium]
MHYKNLVNRLQGLACILGPLLGLLAALAFLAGQQALEGVIGYYGMILFIPLYLALAGIIGQQMPIYGLLCIILGLFAGAFGPFGLAMRVVYVALVRAEVPSAVSAGNFDAAMATLFYAHPEFVLMGILGLLWPLTHVINGIGLLRLGRSSIGSGLFLIAGGVCFFIAQALAIELPVLYPLAMALLLAGSAPIGWQLLKSGPSDFAHSNSLSVRG